MSEQDKRAEDIPQRWKLERGPDGAWNTAQMTTTEDGEWCKASDVAAALAQARREGVGAMRDAVPWHERAFREQVKRIASRLLEGGKHG